MIRRLIVLLIIGIPVFQAYGQAALSVTPAYAVITDEAPYGAFTLVNAGTEGVEVTISARYGVIASTDSTTAVVLDEAGQLGDLTRHLTFFPDRCILPAGGEQVIRYRIHAAPEGGHITLMHFAMQERGAIVDGQVPAVATGLSIVYNLVAPLVYLQGSGIPALTARVLDSTPNALHLYLESRSPWPFLGGIRVLQDGEQLGRAEAAVYTTRLVQVPISRGPDKRRIQLQFDTAYTGLPRAIQRILRVPSSIELTW